MNEERKKCHEYISNAQWKNSTLMTFVEVINWERRNIFEHARFKLSYSFDSMFYLAESEYLEENRTFFLEITLQTRPKHGEPWEISFLLIFLLSLYATSHNLSSPSQLLSSFLLSAFTGTRDTGKVKSSL